MAKVKTFDIDVATNKNKGQPWAVPDGAIAAFITACEENFYVNVTTQYIPVPTPRLIVIVTKLDEKV